MSHLIVVAGHAIYKPSVDLDPNNEKNWILQSYQKDEVPYYIEHIETGVKLAAKVDGSYLIFSGGQSRAKDEQGRIVGPFSEAQGYWLVAEQKDWWGHPDIAQSTYTEEYATDSLENVLFSCCRFYEVTSNLPDFVWVVSWAFKEERFDFHCLETLRIPQARYQFVAANNLTNQKLTEALDSEGDTLALFKKCPWGNSGVLLAKRLRRNPNSRTPPYIASCPPLVPLLRQAQNQPW